MNCVYVSLHKQDPDKYSLNIDDYYKKVKIDYVTEQGNKVATGADANDGAKHSSDTGVDKNQKGNSTVSSLASAGD